ncbi:NAD(P)H-dependent oxidoreductase [Phytohabitans rumicis]|uniref:FMN reductase n=1 Tax=Phytohabitans rumicis TaxID=1076125 RepID=A0A6V8LAX0_9ACTN|nr:NAD(P)H-dependent oxidoreductase [Phytohabitans rumicis]GFJ94353.1 FMN reductase [Phytohabitans rumicis]
MTDLVVLVGNPRPGSRTRALAEALAARLAPIEDTRVLELADVVGVSFGPEPAYGSTSGEDLFALVRSARLLVVATPTYKGTYTGLLKVFLDQFGPGALAGVVAVPVTIAASEPHVASVSAALRDLLVELGASVPAPALAVPESAFGAQALGAHATPTAYVAGWADRHGDEVTQALAVRPAAR